MSVRRQPATVSIAARADPITLAILAQYLEERNLRVRSRADLVRVIMEDFVRLLNELGALKWRPSSKEEALKRLLELRYIDLGDVVARGLLDELAEEASKEMMGVSEEELRKAMEHHARNSGGGIL